MGSTLTEHAGTPYAPLFIIRMPRVSIFSEGLLGGAVVCIYIYTYHPPPPHKSSSSQCCVDRTARVVLTWKRSRRVAGVGRRVRNTSLNLHTAILALWAVVTYSGCSPCMTPGDSAVCPLFANLAPFIAVRLLSGSQGSASWHSGPGPVALWDQQNPAEATCRCQASLPGVGSFCFRVLWSLQ